MTTGSAAWEADRDGFVLPLLWFAVSELNMSVESALDDVSVIMLLLLLRQKAVVEGAPVVSLKTQEMLDSKPWEELVAENRKKLKELAASGFFDAV